jgi:hypothetical protein
MAGRQKQFLHETGKTRNEEKNDIYAQIEILHEILRQRDWAYERVR